MASKYIDVMGVLLLLLVASEGVRKYLTMQDLARIQAEAAQLTSMLELNNLASRRLLAPPSVHRTDIQLLCQAPGKECLPGEQVRCEIGTHLGCDCEYIKACFPRASECSKTNATHVVSCGF